MHGARISVSSPSVLPLMVYRAGNLQAALGITLEQPRVRIRGGRVESQGDPALLGNEITMLASIVAGLLDSKKIIAVYDAARYAELGGWRGSLAAAGFAYGGLIMVAGRPGGLQPVVSRFHVPSDTRVVVTDLPCRPRPRRSLRTMVELLSRAASRNFGDLIRVLGGYGARTLRECGALSHLLEELRGAAAVGASPTGLLYIVGRGIDMCRLGELLLDLGLSEGSVITGPQNYGARVEADVG